MPHTRQLIGDRRRHVRQLLREQLAVLPFARDDAARPVRAQHRCLVERRQQRRVRAGVRGGNRAGHRRDARCTAAGYRTALVGKYLNGYPNTVAPTYGPPGWTTWSTARRSATRTASTTTRSTTTAGSSTTVAAPDGLRHHRVRARTRSTSCGRGAGADSRSSRTSRCTHRTSPPRPHLATRALFRACACAAHRRRTTRSTCTTMPRFVRDLPRFSAAAKAAIDELYRLRIRSLQAVDRGVASARPHAAEHRAARQHVHRVHVRQRLPPRPAPSAGRQADRVRHRHPRAAPDPRPGHRRPGRTSRQLTGNVDLAPTFEAMAGVRAPAFTDGRSLLGLAAGHSSAGRHWRSAYLVEHRNERGTSPRVAPRRRVAPVGATRPRPGRRRAPALRRRTGTHPGRGRTDISASHATQGVLRVTSRSPTTTRSVPAATSMSPTPTATVSSTTPVPIPREIHNLAGTMPPLERALAAAGGPTSVTAGRKGAAWPTRHGPIGRAVRALLRCPASGEPEPPSSSGLGRRPFKAVTGIRTPLGARDRLRSALVL